MSEEDLEEEKTETYKVSLIYNFEIEATEDEDPEELAIKLLAEGGWSLEILTEQELKKLNERT